MGQKGLRGIFFNKKTFVMNYQELKPFILSELVKSESHTLEKEKLMDHIKNRFNGVKGLSKKLFWAMTELLREKDVLESDGKILLSNNLKLEQQTINSASTFLGKRFERECKNMLNHMGFINIKITGKTGDQGVDGTAFYPICNSIKLRVVFQCKSAKSKIGSPSVREFRGSIGPTAVAGILFSSNGFTKDGIREASKIIHQPLFLFDKEAINEYYKEKHQIIKNES